MSECGWVRESVSVRVNVPGVSKESGCLLLRNYDRVLIKVLHQSLELI